MKRKPYEVPHPRVTSTMGRVDLLWVIHSAREEIAILRRRLEKLEADTKLGQLQRRAWRAEGKVRRAEKRERKLVNEVRRLRYREHLFVTIAIPDRPLTILPGDSNDPDDPPRDPEAQGPPEG